MAPVKTGDEGAERYGLNRDYIAGTFEEVKERLLGDPDFWRAWEARYPLAAGVPDRPATDEKGGWGGPPTPVFVTRGDRFPEVTIVFTRVTATITATFEVRSKHDAEAAEARVDAAMANLASGEVTVSYDTERVEE